MAYDGILQSRRNWERSDPYQNRGMAVMFYSFRRAFALMYRVNASGFPGGANSNVMLIESLPVLVFVSRNLGADAIASLRKTTEAESFENVTV